MPVASRVVLLFLILQSIPQSILSQQNEFPYTQKKTDLYLTSVSLATLISGEYINARMKFNLSIDEIKQLDRQNINSFDRPASYNWNTKLNSASDILAYSLPFLPATVLLPKIRQKKWENIRVVGLMYLQVYGFTRGITQHTKSFSGRIRPYLYNTSLTPEERFNFQENEGPEASNSFFSGHTSIAFSSAVFLSKMFTDIYGKSPWSYTIWATSLTAASLTGYFRIASGEHFTTDVLTGAAVGSAIGYLIPLLHTRKFKDTSLAVLPDGFNMVVSF